VTFQRILTYTLNSVTKKVVQVLFLVVGLVMTGHAILTPMLMVIILLTGDLLGMSLTTDDVRPSPTPNSWRIGALTIAGVSMGISVLVFCTAVLAVARFRLGFGVEALRTVAFVVIVFGNQAATYMNREHQRMRSCRPSPCLVASSVIDVLIASTLAILGIGGTRVPMVFCRRNAHSGGMFCVRGGLCEAPFVQASRDRLESAHRHPGGVSDAEDRNPRLANESIAVAVVSQVTATGNMSEDHKVGFRLFRRPGQRLRDVAAFDDDIEIRAHILLKFADLFCGEADDLLLPFGIDVDSSRAVLIHADRHVNQRQSSADGCSHSSGQQHCVSTVRSQFHGTEHSANRKRFRWRHIGMNARPDRTLRFVKHFRGYGSQQELVEGAVVIRRHRD